MTTLNCMKIGQLVHISLRSSTVILTLRYGRFYLRVRRSSLVVRKSLCHGTASVDQETDYGRSSAMQLGVGPWFYVEVRRLFEKKPGFRNTVLLSSTVFKNTTVSV